MLVRLVVGDWSKDGHNQTTDFICRLTASADVQKFDVGAHYKKAFKKIGVDITKYCKEYEDNELPEDARKILKEKLNLELDDTLMDWDFVNVYIEIFNSLDSAIQLEIMGNIDTYNIGGYGLFY